MKISKKNDKYKKILEITKDNLNTILLDLKNNKELLKVNIKNIIIFLFKNFESPEEILCKLYILHKFEDYDDNVDNVAGSCIKILDIKKNIGDMFMIEYIFSLDYFSRMFSLWYFTNKELSIENNNKYSKKCIKMIYDICRINFDNEIAMNSDFSGSEEDNNSNLNDNEEDNKLNFSCSEKANKLNSNDNEEDNKLNSNFSLIDLDDSKEIERLDKQLGSIFYDKFNISKSDKQKIAKICDILDLIIIKKKYFNINYYHLFINLVDIDDLLYKKIFKIIKHSSDKELYIKLLENTRNIWRNMNQIIKVLDHKEIFDCVIYNEESTLEYLDRSLVNKDEFYKFIFNKIDNKEEEYNDIKEELIKFDNLIIHFMKRESDEKIISRFNQIINDN